MAVIRFRNINKKFVEIPLGGVSDSQIEESVKKYLEENPVEFIERDPTVPYWAKQPSKPSYDADEIWTKDKRTVEETIALKADKSDTYTKDEVVNLINSEIGEALEGDY